MTNGQTVGVVTAQWRYPVKSMRGEMLHTVEVWERGIIGDRAFALVDQQDGKVASAKNPRKWPNLFGFSASYLSQPEEGRGGMVQITFPDGKTATSDQADLSAVLSVALGRKVAFRAQVPEQPQFECYVPELDDGSQQNDVVTVDMPRETFFDSCVLHLLTTASLRRLAELYPEGQFDERRFRPNLVIDAPDARSAFIENDWIGRTLALGDQVLIRVTEPCTRCVMTTLPQSDLRNDPGILRAAAQHNNAAVGVRTIVLRGGTIRRGDPVRLH